MNKSAKLIRQSIIIPQAIVDEENALKFLFTKTSLVVVTFLFKLLFGGLPFLFYRVQAAFDNLHCFSASQERPFVHLRPVRILQSRKPQTWPSRL